MVLASTYNGYLGFVKQAAQGTALAPTKFVKFLSPVKMDAEQEINIYPEGGGGFYNAVAQKKLHKVGGSFDCNLAPEIGGALFAYFLGADAITGAAVPYTHTLTPARPLPWLTIERGLKTNLKTERAFDVRLGKLGLEGKAGEPLKLSVDFTGAQSSLFATNATDTYETTRAWTFMDGTFTLLGGAYTKISGFKLELDNNLETDVQTTEVYLQEVPPGKLVGKFSFDIVYDSADVNYAMILFGAGLTIVETLATGTAVLAFTYGATTLLRSATFTIPAGGLVYRGMTDPAPGPEPKTLRQTIVCDIIKLVGSEYITAAFNNAMATSYFA